MFIVCLWRFITNLPCLLGGVAFFLSVLVAFMWFNFFLPTVSHGFRYLYYWFYALPSVYLLSSSPFFSQWKPYFLMDAEELLGIKRVQGRFALLGLPSRAHQLFGCGHLASAGSPMKKFASKKKKWFTISLKLIIL